MLTEELRKIISEKKMQALANRKRVQEELHQEVVIPDDSKNSEYKKLRLDDLPCSECSSYGIDKSFADAFDVKVCRDCIKAGSRYDLLPKGKVTEEYLLPESSLKKMKFLMKENPRNKNWSGMKLYLRKYCEEEAVHHFGSLEGLRNEIEKRKCAKFHRALEKSSCSFSLGGSSKERTPSNEKLSSQRSKVMAMVQALQDDNDS